jgi:hypothetical protein
MLFLSVFNYIKRLSFIDTLTAIAILILIILSLIRSFMQFFKSMRYKNARKDPKINKSDK